MWNYCEDGNVEEYKVTYWVCMSMISASPFLSDKIVKNEVCYIDLGDSERLISTQEDMYLYALLELYKLYVTEYSTLSDTLGNML